MQDSDCSLPRSLFRTLLTAINFEGWSHISPESEELYLKFTVAVRDSPSIVFLTRHANPLGGPLCYQWSLSLPPSSGTWRAVGAKANTKSCYLLCIVKSFVSDPKTSCLLLARAKLFPCKQDITEIGKHHGKLGKAHKVRRKTKFMLLTFRYMTYFWEFGLFLNRYGSNWCFLCMIIYSLWNQ